MRAVFISAFLMFFLPTFQGSLAARIASRTHSWKQEGGMLVVKAEQESLLAINETWVEVDMAAFSDGAAVGESRSLLSVREHEGGKEHSGKFGMKFGKFGKFGLKFGKFGKFGKIGKHGYNRRRKYHGGGYFDPGCNTACGANEWNGYRFNHNMFQLRSDQCAYCKWQVKGLTRCGYGKEKLVRLDFSKACCLVRDNQPRCSGGRLPGQGHAGGGMLPGQGHGNGPRIVRVVAEINGPGTQNYYDAAMGSYHTVQVPAGVWAGMPFDAAIY